MHIVMIDGKAVFARWMVGDVPVCTEKQRDKLVAETKLQAKAIKSPPAELVTKAAGIIYQSRSEAIAHLLEGKEPQSQILQKLIKRVEAVEQEIFQIKGGSE